MSKMKTELENYIDKNKQKTIIPKPVLWSTCCPYKTDVIYTDDLPSMTRQEFAAECDINNVMKNFEATGVMPEPNREPIYWDADAVPSDLHMAMDAMNYASSLFMQLNANIRKEFDNDPVRFVEFATASENYSKLKEWGLTAPEIPAGAPVRVEVVTPNPPASNATSGVPMPAPKVGE